jgi:DNA replication protein DnaC
MKDQPIGELISKVQNQPLSLKEVLENYSHITLTDDEILEAMIAGKIKKEEELRIAALREKEKANREQSKQLWNFDVIRTFMVGRAKELFQGKFILDESNDLFFDTLCEYFTESEKFCKSATKLVDDDNVNEDDFSLQKGLLIPGNFGTGKTWMMKLFQKNARQTYWIRTAKEISQAYLNSEDKKIPEEYTTLFKNPINDASVFYQPVSGLCIDDLGSESKKNNFGNIMNVVGDLIESRYEKKFTGLYLHATTNLSAEELKGFYGERVISRMREIFNFIELPGSDRRK